MVFPLLVRSVMSFFFDRMRARRACLDSGTSKDVLRVCVSAGPSSSSTSSAEAEEGEAEVPGKRREGAAAGEVGTIEGEPTVAGVIVGEAEEVTEEAVPVVIVAVVAT